MYTVAEALLDGPNGAFDLVHVAVGCDNVHSNWVNGIADAFELVVSLNVADGKTMGVV